MALTNLTKVQTVGIGSNIEVVGVVTTGQFKSGTSNLHSTGVELTNLNVSGIATIGGNISIGGTLTYQDVTNVDAIGIITARSGINITGGNITLGDSSGSSDDRIKLGASSDCHIHHNGTDTFISNDTGDLVLNNIGGNSDDIFIRSKDDITLQVQSSENAIVCKGDGAVELYYNNTKMLETNIPSGHNGEVILGQKVHVRHTASGNGQIFPASGNLYLNAKQDETSVLLAADAGVHLNYNNSQKFVTTNTGVVISGICTATSFSGDGSALTGLSGVSVANQADNRLITATGTTDALNGEGDLTFDGNQLYINNQNYEPPILINSIQSSVRATIRQTNDANANSGLAIQKRHSSLHPANHWYGDISFEGWDGSGYHRAGLIECVAEGTPANNNMPGGLRFSTNPGAASQIERLRIKPDGNVEVKTGNLVMSTAGKGIDFSADGSGTLKSLPNSFNAELLHDYENGTFTPNIQYDTGTNRYSGSNVSSAVGEYIRIGDLVSFGMKITLTGNRNVSENIYMYIGGLPYNGMHSSQQSSMMQGWGGWVCPSNDSNSSYQVHNCKHSYTTVDVRFEQSSGTGGIDGFFVWGFYRTAP